MHRPLVALTSLLIFGAACVAEEEPEIVPLGAAPSPIEGGYLDDFDKHVVGLIHLSNTNFGACSGTLIAPNVVLTAQHCVAPTSTGGGVQCGSPYFGAAYKANEFYVTTRTSFTQNESDYHPVSEVILPPGGSSFCGNDQAILVLAAPIEAGEAVPAVPRVDVSLAPDEEYYAVGYGAQYDSDNAPSGTRQRRDGLFTQCVGAGCDSYGIADSEFLGDTGVCQGDSGGPAFDLQHRVTGVASRGAAGCEFPIYGHVFGWGQWIKDVTVYATTSIGEAPPPWATGYPTDPAYSHPVGDACTQPADCASNACSGGYCTRLCIPEAPCPEGFECSGEGWCVKVEPPPAPPTASDPGDATVVNGCTAGPAKDPTKPIPWKWGALALAVVALRRRKV